MNNATNIILHFKGVLKGTIATFVILFRVMIPVSIIVKILEYTGLITQI